MKPWKSVHYACMPPRFHGIAIRRTDRMENIFVLMPFNLIVYAVYEGFLLIKYLRGKTLIHKIEEMELDKRREYLKMLEDSLEEGQSYLRYEASRNCIWLSRPVDKSFLE